jgi:hypothetical protein
VETILGSVKGKILQRILEFFMTKDLKKKNTAGKILGLIKGNFFLENARVHQHQRLNNENTGKILRSVIGK